MNFQEDAHLYDTGLEDEERAETPPRQNAPATYSGSTNLFRAHAALLDTIVVAPELDTDAYRLVRTHFPTLEHWHEQHTGWRIQRGSGFYRLERHPYTSSPVFHDERLKRPRDFVCLTWLLWFAEKRHLAGGGRNQQFLLSQLADELQKQSAIVSENGLDFRNQQDRYSISRVLDYLTDLGALRTLEGEVRKWIEDTEQADNEVLYEFTPIAHSLVEALNERRVKEITTLLERGRYLLPPGTLTPLAETIPPLFRAWRALLLGPALFRYDDPHAFAALTAQAEQVNSELAETFGWLLELNNDYACIVRGGGLSIGAGPGLTLNSAYDQMLLLLCTAFRQQVEQNIWNADAYGCLSVTHWDIIPLFSELRQRFGSYWGATVQSIKATDLLAEIYQRMRLLGLLRGPDMDGRVLILPTAARYNVSYTQEPPEERMKPRSRKKMLANTQPMPTNETSPNGTRQNRTGSAR